MYTLIENHNENRNQATLMVHNLDSWVKTTWVESYLQNLLAVWLDLVISLLCFHEKEENNSNDLMS